MKYKKGDWIKHRDGNVFHVAGIEEGYYILKGAEGYVGFISIEIIDKSSYLIDVQNEMMEATIENMESTQNEMKVAFHKGYITAIGNMEKLIKELKNRINYDETSIGTNPSEIQGGQADNG